MEIEKLKKDIAKIIVDELGALDTSDKKDYLAFFFGSRINGTANDRSDLDVGIEMNEGEVPKDKMLNIKLRCEALPTLYKIDVVDFYFLSEDFKKVAKTKIEIIG